MECLSQLCSIVPCLWDFSAKHAVYVVDLEENLNSLSIAMTELNNLSEDVKNKVTEAEEQHRRPKNQVTGWLRSVEALGRKVNPVLEKGTQEIENKCVGSCCPKNCWSSYKLGKEVLKMLPQVQGLIEKGGFDNVADENLLVAPVDELPMDGTVVGFESKFEELWQCVRDKDSSIIGLVGTGGVGKTTLLKQLNNEFLETNHGFDLVIWIVVSKPANLGAIWDTIRTKLNIPDYLWENKNEDQRISLIFNKLKDKKFVMLLDDLWEGFELSKVGIPQPCTESKWKVVFTTRSHEVFQCMDAHKCIKVDCLPPDQALSLFCSKVGEETLRSHQEILEFVKDVARECQGLPLALITIGRSMRGKTTIQQWKDAKRVLQMYPSSFLGMKDGIFYKLLFSYDNLSTPTLKKCFEYCSIFPEERSICKETLVQLWVAEGIIDEYSDMYDALILGRQITENLMQSCLLEVGEWEETVKMHDMIRDMALWLACERGEKNNKFLVVDATNGDDGVLAITKWRNPEKVSLWGGCTTDNPLAGWSLGSSLVTLIIRDTHIKVLPSEIFLSTKGLKVLDLFNNIDLIDLPAEIGNLIDLEYLNIISTRIRQLPAEVQNLKKLRMLMIGNFAKISGEVISTLVSLETFEQDYEGGWIIDVEAIKERQMLEELEGLKHIMDLSFVMRKATSIEILLDSPKLQRCLRQLTLVCGESVSSLVLDFSKWRLIDHLERLKMIDCKMLGIKFGSSHLNNIQHVEINRCSEIRNVSSLVYVPNLRTLYVGFCKSLEELIGEDAMMEGSLVMLLFSSLTSLKLMALPKLSSICPHALPFPSLKYMEVTHCETLRKLPFDSNTANTAPLEFKIQGHWLWRISLPNLFDDAYNR